MMIVASPRVRAKQKKNTNYLLSSVVYKLTVVGQIFWKQHELDISPISQIEWDIFQGCQLQQVLLHTHTHVHTYMQ